MKKPARLISSLTHADVMDNDRGSPVQPSIWGNGLSDGQGAKCIEMASLSRKSWQ